MKKVMIWFVFLMMAGIVAAMEDPIKVKTGSGDSVIIHVWPLGDGPLLNTVEGIADSEGLFSHTFFSLSDPFVKYHVIIKRNNQNFRSGYFDYQSTNNPSEIDCNSGDSCSISIVNKSEIVEENETVEEVVVGNETIVENGEETPENLFTGFAFYNKSDGSLNIIYPIGLVVLLLFFILFFILFSKRGKSEGIKFNREDKELRDIESKIEAKENEINVIKYSDLKKKKIQDAKRKLAEEEEELNELSGEKGEVDNSREII